MINTKLYQAIDNLKSSLLIKDAKIAEPEAQINNSNKNKISFIEMTNRNSINNKLPKQTLQLMFIMADENTLIKKREKNLIINIWLKSNV